MPVAYGPHSTHRQILLYSVLLFVIALMPALATGMLGAIYLLTATVLGLGLIWMAVKLIRKSSKAMARSMYKYSTTYLALLFLAMVLDTLLH
jgi:heme o synthase